MTIQKGSQERKKVTFNSDYNGFHDDGLQMYKVQQRKICNLVPIGIKCADMSNYQNIFQSII